MQLILGVGVAMMLGLAGAGDTPSPPQVKEPELRKELLERVKADQEARKAIMELMRKQGAAQGGQLNLSDAAAFGTLAAKMKALDKANTKWLKGVVEKQGWPTASRVGKDGAHAAWLLVQHADHDPKFQRLCLDLMTKLPADEVSPTDLAYLTDRVLLAEGKNQLYGTQIYEVNGKWEARSLEDPEHVDERRKKLGLQPLAEYIKIIEQEYGKAKK